MLTTDELVQIYKTPSNHKKFITEMEETFSDELKCSSDLPEINSEIYFKMTSRNENHRGIPYKDGPVWDTQPFNPSGCCSGGGLYFTSLEKLHMFENFGNNIRPIIVPSGVPIYNEVCMITTNGHVKCPKFHYKSKAPMVFVLPKIKMGSEESFELLYNPQKDLLSGNNQFVASRAYLSDTTTRLKMYADYYGQTYTCLNGNSWGTQLFDHVPIKPIPYAKKRKFHPEHKQLIHCIVKELILLQKYDELVTIINEKKTLLYWLYYKPTNKFYQDRAVSISELFYIFLKHQDKTFLYFMQEEYFSRQLSLQLRLRSPGEQEQEQWQGREHMDYAVHSINEDMASIIDINIYKLILKYQGIISGSYALKHYIGAKWQCDDIDIYLPAYDCVPGPYECYKYSAFVDEVSKSVGNTACAYPCDTGSESRREGAPTYNMTNIDEIVNISQKNGIKLQFIFVKVDPFEFIKDNFDFDFCKVCFRPEVNRFECSAAPSASASASGIAGKIDQTYMDKISKYNMGDNYSIYRAAKTMDRISKYIARGFTITNLDEFFNCLEKLF